MPDHSSVLVGPKLGKLIYGDVGANFPNSFRTMLRALDQLIQCSVKSRVIATPPGSPADGDAYIVPSSPTGAWAGQTGKIAVFTTKSAATDTNVVITAGAWEFYTARAGWLVYSEADTGYYVYSGSAWAVLATPGVELTANKGVANGYAGLDSGAKVPTAQLPSVFPTLGAGGANPGYTFNVLASVNGDIIAKFKNSHASGFGVAIVPGNDSPSYALKISNAAETANALTFYGDGSMQFGSGAKLNAYQEGTWTPVKGGGAIATSVTFTGSYTRIGRLGFFRIHAVIANGGRLKFDGGSDWISHPFNLPNHGPGCDVLNGPPGLITPGVGMAYMSAVYYPHPFDWTNSTGGPLTMHFSATVEVSSMAV